MSNATAAQIDGFLQKEGINCLTLIDSQDEGRFSWRGCDICADNLGNNVFDCHGYNPETRDIQEGYAICGSCLNYIYNGEIVE